MTIFWNCHYWKTTPVPGQCLSNFPSWQRCANGEQSLRCLPAPRSLPRGNPHFPIPFSIYALVLLFCKHTVLALHLGWQAGEGGMKRLFPQTSSTLKFPAQTGLYTNFKTSPSPVTLLFNYSSFKITIIICVHDHDVGFQHFFTAVFTIFSNK